ncbi:MAG: hypothetical protein ABSA30_15140 [Candidatus Aminicenantales bacterium]
MARLAGVPREVIERSKDILAQLEEEHLDAEGRPEIARRRNAPIRSPIQLTLFGFADHPLLDELRQVDLDRTAPLDALALLKKWQDKLNSERKP